MNAPLSLEIAHTAARFVVEEGLEWGPAKRRAVRELGLPARTALPDNDQLEDAIREYLDLFCADTQPGELRALREHALTWMERLAQGTPIVLSALHVNDVALLHLPAESFLEYQLRAQQMRPAGFVATAAYGDGGPWYIPVREAFPQGGYEVSVANCAEAMDELMTAGIRQVLSA